MVKKWAILIILSGAFSTGSAQTPRAQDYEAFYRKCYGAGSRPSDCKLYGGHLARARRKDNMATAYKNRGNAYDDKGQYDQTLEDHGRAIATNPQDADAFSSRGTTYIALGRYELAVQDFDQAVRLDPASPVALSNRCFAKAVLGELEQALECDKAPHVKPKYPGAYASRALTYMKLKRYDAAIADYTTQLQTLPNDPYALFGRGWPST